MCSEELTLEHAKDTSCDAVIGLKVLGCPWSMGIDKLRSMRTSVARRDIEKCAQRVVYAFFVLASRGHDVIELCAAGQYWWGHDSLEVSHHPKTVAHSRGCTTLQMPYCVRGPATKIIVPGNAGSGSYRARRKAVGDV